MKYSTFKYPCIDKYPEGRGFVSNDQLLRMAQRRIQSGKVKSSLNTEYTKLKAAFLENAIWKVPTLNIAFLDGTEKQKSWVRRVVGNSLEPLMDRVKFNWSSGVNSSHIRISFRLIGQAWSMLGTQADFIPKSEPTMNLGWLDDDVQFNNEMLKGTGMVVLHEFGHAIGMIHEHQNPKNNPIRWNREVIYRELARTNGWNKQMVDNNMFKKYGDYTLCQQAKEEPDDLKRQLDIKNFCEGELVNGSTYDITSIMHYFYPPSWILEGPEIIPVNSEFSELDKKWIRKNYGTPLVTEEPEITPTEDDPTTEDIDTELEIAMDTKEQNDANAFRFYVMTILAIIILIGLLYLVFVYLTDTPDKTFIPPPYPQPRIQLPTNRFYGNM